MAERAALPYPTASQIQLLYDCKASFWGEKGLYDHVELPGSQKNEAADLGTNIHSCIEAGFKISNDPFAYLKGVASDGSASSWMLSDAMNKALELDCVDEFTDAVSEVRRVLVEHLGFEQIPNTEDLIVGPRIFTWPEKVVVLAGEGKDHSLFSGAWNPKRMPDPYNPAAHGPYRLAGRADVIGVSRHGDTIVVVDWKTGAHEEKTEGMFNLQLLSLAYMGLHGMSAFTPKGEPDYGFSSRILVKMVVPYLTHPEDSSVVAVSGDTVIRFFETNIMPLLKRPEPPNLTSNSGHHCLYCKRKSACQRFAMSIGLVSEGRWMKV